MKNTVLLLFALCWSLSSFAQNEDLPKGFAKGEEAQMETYLQSRFQKNACTDTGIPTQAFRSIAEWEELQAIVVSWDNLDRGLLADIIRHARLECKVVVIASSPSTARTQLQNQYEFEDFENIEFVDENTNSIWIRDYGANSCYANDVDSLVLVDWIYNRPRPFDDDAYCTVSEQLGIPMVQTVLPPTDLVHTGGNFMSDGLGMGFSSKLLIEENDYSNEWGESNHSEEDIENIMQQYMGIEEYVLMETLPFDGIHHIDMHMKLLNEETLLVGMYPDSISDGPQIEANLEYILQNYKTSFGTDFMVERIVMPADSNGYYPGNPFGNSDYMTYANALFVNKTILVPIYMTSDDDIALNVWRNAMPGYNVVGLDCRQIINYSGAIHCITKEIGVENPLWIAHRQQRDTVVFSPTDFEITAHIQHRLGIDNARLYYKTNIDAPYESVAMNPMAGEHQWMGLIPAPQGETTIYYYIEATANSGKTITRPLPAPEGYFDFNVSYLVSTDETITPTLAIGDVFPNPAQALTYVPITSQKNTEATIEVLDALGKCVLTIFEGQLHTGAYKYFFDVRDLSAGIYFVKIDTEEIRKTKKLIVK